jgi:hypothetical protein
MAARYFVVAEYYAFFSFAHWIDLRFYAFRSGYAG